MRDFGPVWECCKLNLVLQILKKILNLTIKCSNINLFKKLINAFARVATIIC